MLNNMKEPEHIMDPMKLITRKHILGSIQNNTKVQEHTQDNTIVHQNNLQDIS